MSEELPEVVVNLDDGADAALTRVQRPASLAAFETAFAAFAIMFTTGGLTRLLTGGLPEEVARTTSSPLVQLSGAGIFGLTLVLLSARAHRFFPQIIRNGFLFLPVLLAIVSTVWSPFPELTLRRSLSLFGTTALGVYIALRFDRQQIASLLFLSLAAIVCGSFAVAVLLPGFGVHQASDVLTGHHAGLWRGLFWHKNALGPLASVMVLVTLIFWRQLHLSARLKFAVAAMAAITVVGTGSAQALFQLFFFGPIILVHLALSGQDANFRVAAFFAMAALVVAGLPLIGAIQSIILDLLNRDATLSSRTAIWAVALIGAAESPIIGSGYSVGWISTAYHIAQQRFYIEVGNAHNGFLDLWLDLGLLGVCLLAMVLLAYLVRLFRVSRRSRTAYMFGLHFLLFYLISNTVASFLMQYQDIFWLMFCVSFVSMAAVDDTDRQHASMSLAARASGSP